MAYTGSIVFLLIMEAVERENQNVLKYRVISPINNSIHLPMMENFISGYRLKLWKKEKNVFEIFYLQRVSSQEYE